MHTHVAPKNRLSFLNTRPPPNYVPGLGRGATAFITRSDIGPAHDLDEFECNDEFEYYKEADAVRDNITQQFADVKRKLATVSASEWDNIPEVKDYSFRYNNKKKKMRRFESYVPVPDHTLLDNKAMLEKEHLTSFNPRTRETLDLTAVGEGRGTVLSLKLDSLLDNVSGLTVVDPKGYLTSLDMKSSRDAEVLDIKKARLLFKSVIRTNKSMVLRMGLEKIPDSVRLWKTVVELANEDEAKLLLERAVECCPLHVELWLGLARLEEYDAAKKVLNKAREKLPKEPAIWIAAAKLEEAFGNTSMVGKIIEKGIRTLQREGVEIDREAWMKEAEAAERTGSVATCNAIISNTTEIGEE